MHAAAQPPYTDRRLAIVVLRRGGTLFGRRLRWLLFALVASHGTGCHEADLSVGDALDQQGDAAANADGSVTTQPGSTRSTSGTGSGTGGSGGVTAGGIMIRDASITEEGGVSPGPDSATPAGSCSRAGASCTHPDQCCSHACVDDICVDFGACQPADTDCTSASQCCSGRCEPLTGTEAVRCLPYCLADGVPCKKALDCCSLGCFGGVCGGGLCHIESDSCTTNADCCSNICDPQKGECQIDPAQPDCRPTGETCTSGRGSGCCGACDDATDRCAFAPGTCRAQGVGCTQDSDCCKGRCLPNDRGTPVCMTPCFGTGQTCSQDAECCSFACDASSGRCVEPPAPSDGGPGCLLVNVQCNVDMVCCSDHCINGFCDVPCRLSGVTCTMPADCCSGICFGGLCQPAVN